MKKKSKSLIKKPRSASKYPNLHPDLNLKSRYEEIEDLHSYMDKLDEDCKAWLDKFANEYINASFDHDNPLHTKEQEQEIYNRNNARNRCIMTRSKAFGAMGYLEDSPEQTSDETEEESDYKSLVDRMKFDRD